MKLLIADETVTDVEFTADAIIDRIVDTANDSILSDCKPFVDKGFIPTKIISEYSPSRNITKTEVLKYLTDRGLIERPEIRKQMVEEKRLPTYKMTDKLKAKIKKE